MQGLQRETHGEFGPYARTASHRTKHIVREDAAWDMGWNGRRAEAEQPHHRVDVIYCF